MVFSGIDLAAVIAAGIEVEEIECFYKYAQKVDKGEPVAVNMSQVRTKALTHIYKQLTSYH